jgi:hypothetical protein
MYTKNTTVSPLIFFLLFREKLQARELSLIGVLSSFTGEEGRVM